MRDKIDELQSWIDSGNQVLGNMSVSQGTQNSHPKTNRPELWAEENWEGGKGSTQRGRSMPSVL